MAIKIDFTNMMADVVGGGVSAGDWKQAHIDFSSVRAKSHRLRDTGQLGFLALPTDAALHASVDDFAKRSAGKFDDVVVLGIGGSALGPIAIRTALLPSGWNSLDKSSRGGRPRMHVLDNVDPRTIAALLAELDASRTIFVVISKSGGTAETMAQYMVLRGWLQQKLGAGADKDHLVFVTDPQKGALRAIARSDGIVALDIPPAVGGRYSVLCPVGTLPAALVGVDVASMLAGAADMAARCDADSLDNNPAGVFGTLQFLSDTRGGKHMHVLMPYSDALRDSAGWYAQLWAESLGKHRVEGDPGVGPTPIAALGATDQHSQVQLYMEGPADKTITMIAVEERGPALPIPHLHPGVAELAYLGGHDLGELLTIERQATAGALARRGRPNMTIHVDKVDAWHLGGLFMMLEAATIHAGMLYEIDPLNQPGVELGKQFTYAMLGRPGADAARKEWDALPKPNPSRMV